MDLKLMKLNIFIIIICIITTAGVHVNCSTNTINDSVNNSETVNALLIDAKSTPNLSELSMKNQQDVLSEPFKKSSESPASSSPGQHQQSTTANNDDNNNNEEFKQMKYAFHSVTKQMDKFNEFYLTNLDHKMTTILQTMTVLDTNIKSLQEKAQVWNIFQHHIDAWTDHMKSVDQKIDLIKRHLDNGNINGGDGDILNIGKLSSSTAIDQKLTSMEFTINHVLTKIDLLNEKYNDFNKNTMQWKKLTNSGSDLNGKIQEMHNILLQQERLDRFGKKDILNRLLILQRQLQYLDRPTIPTLKTATHPIRRQSNEQLQKNGIFMLKSNGRKFKSGSLLENKQQQLRHMKYLNDDENQRSKDDEEDDDDVAGDGDEMDEEENDNTEDNEEQERQREQQIAIEQLMNIIKKLNNNFDRLSIKEFKQIVGNNRKSIRTLDSLSDLMQAIDDRTVRLYDAQANHYKRLMVCCKATGNEVTTFTNSGDLILKRIEKFILNLDHKIDRINDRRCLRSDDDGTVVVKKFPLLNETIDLNNDEDDDEDDDNGSGAAEIPIEKTHFKQPTKQSCHQVQSRINGIYTFGRTSELNAAKRNFNQRYCEFNTDGMGWLVIQRRGQFHNDDDNNNNNNNKEHLFIPENFNRSWDEYKTGFGNLNGEFWFGNDFIHRLTYDDNVELRVVLENWDGTSVWAEYAIFRIESEKYNYNLMISGYRGAVSDSMLYHNNQDFSTYDRNNDKSNGIGLFACASSYGSGWWFNNCTEANLNGIYHETPRGHNYIGIIWEHWLGDYSLKSAKMMIRPRDLWFNDDETDVFLEPPDDP